MTEAIDEGNDTGGGDIVEHVMMGADLLYASDEFEALDIPLRGGAAPRGHSR